jgi:hypothetical protein
VDIKRAGSHSMKRVAAVKHAVGQVYKPFK